MPNREICSKETPMTKARQDFGVHWEHIDAHETDLDSEYRIEYKCPNCGVIWSTEMPD